MTFLGEQDGDMEWLHDVYGAPAEMKCAILHGNEDSATKIEAWREFNPNHDVKPDWIYTSPEV